MIYLHKILPVFLLPTGVSILLVVAGLLLRRRALCWIGVAVLWLASMPLVGDAAMRAAEGWQIRRPLFAVPAAEAIVVLSEGRIQPRGDPAISEWMPADRFYGGVDLFKAGKAPLLIFTGGWAPWQPEAKLEGDVLMGYAADLGIPRDRMVSTAKVVSTHEEARAVDNSAPLPIRPQSTYKSGNVVQTSGATSTAARRIQAGWIRMTRFNTDHGTKDLHL